MTVITFDDNLITGNKTIDEQHKELIDRIQQFVSACESEDARVKAIKMRKLRCMILWLRSTQSIK